MHELFVYLRVATEALLSAGLGAENALELGASGVSAHRVADGAEVLEKFLALTGISSGFLLTHCDDLKINYKHYRR